MWLVNETEWRSPPVPYPSTQQDLGKRACRLKAYVWQKGIERPITIFEIMQLLEGSIVSLSDIGFFFFFFLSSCLRFLSASLFSGSPQTSLQFKANMLGCVPISLPPSIYLYPSSGFFSSRFSPLLGGAASGVEG